ncbi:MAG: MFS transporter [Sphingobium sp.]|nr:MFS transporter [Sphingobium sp.]
MNEVCWLALAMASFVGTHLLLSHPLRAPLVRAVGAQPFLGLYSLVSALTLGWTIYAAIQVPPLAPLWVAPAWLWHVVTLLMLLASILLVGSLIGNPAMVDPTGNPKFPENPRGVLAITRHPMMWAFMLWAIGHALVWSTPDSLIVTAGIGGLALIGSLAQDRKKVHAIGAPWRDWQAKTSYAPFGAQLSRRLPWRSVVPGPAPLIGGIAIWLGATWLHPLAGGPVAGPWMWMN